MSPVQSRSGRLTLLLIVAVVVLPGLLAVLLYLGGWRPTGSVSHGQILQPPAQVGDIEFTRPDGTLLRLSSLAGKWILFYRLPEDCGPDCVASLYGLRMAHLAQGTEIDRVRRVAITPSAAEAKRLASRDGDLLTLSGTTEQLQRWQQRLTTPTVRTAPGANAPDMHAIYLMDPKGNVILRYTQETDPAGVRKDLTRLLKQSWVG